MLLLWQNKRAAVSTSQSHLSTLIIIKIARLVWDQKKGENIVWWINERESFTFAVSRFDLRQLVWKKASLVNQLKWEENKENLFVDFMHQHNDRKKNRPEFLIKVNLNRFNEKRKVGF